MFSVKILGCGSAAPSLTRWPTSQVVQLNGSLILIDCGEGTQFLLRKYSVKFQRISHILISHLHGDHFFGLPGLLSTMHLLGRQKPLEIHAPAGMKQILKMLLDHGGADLSYDLAIKEYEQITTQIVDDNNFTIETIPLKHRITTCGFLIREKEGLRNIIKAKVADLNLPKYAYSLLRNGEDVETGGRVIKADDVTKAPATPKAYAYCSDTAYNPEMVEQIRGVNALYHEATFLSDREDLATKTAHSTAQQAAQIASDAEVDKLVLGHYSNRYTDIQLFKNEAKLVFENVILAEEGLDFIV